MNSDFITAHADVLVTDIEASETTDVEQSVAAVFQRVFQRAPDEEELRAATEFLSADDNNLALFAQALLISNEFWFVD